MNEKSITSKDSAGSRLNRQVDAVETGDCDGVGNVGFLPLKAPVILI